MGLYDGSIWGYKEAYMRLQRRRIWGYQEGLYGVVRL